MKLALVIGLGMVILGAMYFLGIDIFTLIETALDMITTFLNAFL